jgi:FkbH-like protein
MTWRLESMPWLLPCPDDFRARCKLIDEMNDGQGDALRSLANYCLSTVQLNRLAKSIGNTQDISPLLPFRLGLLSNTTTDFIEPALIGSALRHGVALEIISAPYDQVIQEVINPQSALFNSNVDATLLALDYRGVPFDGEDLGSLKYVESIREKINERNSGPVIVQTIPRPPESLFGSFDFRVSGNLRRRIDSFNRNLVDSLDGSADILLDTAGLAETVGLDVWHDPVQWHLAKLPLAQELLPLYANFIARLIGAIRGRARRCLVLDLDNTLWGGVIGDDGLEHIELGQGTAQGEAFIAVQQTALNLKDRGVLLAVSSKNDDAVARQPFQDHPDMLLSESDISVFQANWLDKATNIEAISKELGLGLDAFVFLDDNPVEREQVRTALPDVAVPELPEDPAYFSRTLLAAGYFEALGFSSEDKQRAQSYQANARRAELQTTAQDLDDFLDSLTMEISFAEFDSVGRSRIAQLVNKSNQFNLTTIRYTESDIAHFENDSNIETFQIRLKDKFGDNGMISVVICEHNGDALKIDLWLMSCRVLGRRVEEAVLNEIIRKAALLGKTKLIGRYIDSGRNLLVQDHYKKLGFTLISENDGESTWHLELKNHVTTQLPFSVSH